MAKRSSPVADPISDDPPVRPPIPPETLPDTGEPFHHPPLRITCSSPGFRRAGVVHAAVADHPADTFTREQLEALSTEPKLKLSPAPESE